MSDDEGSPIVPGNSVNDIYAAQFRRHLAEVKAHLTGINGGSRPSYVPPNGYWTPTEKDAFFHALSIHSRLRPDLIAACIATKTVIDVCTYTDFLDKSLSQNQHLHLQRPDLDGAMEVSNAWIRWEEKEAETLSFLEPKWEDEALLHQREEEISAKRALLPGVANEAYLAFDEEVFEVWERKKRQQWSQEDALKRLDSRRLKVMEAILKEADPVNGDSGDELSDDQRAQDSTSSPAPDIEDPRTTQIIPIHDSASLSQTAHTLIEHLPPIQFQKVEEDDEMTISPSVLSPASRRRFQKRLYMRRKRAAHSGGTTIGAVAKLRPGRKTMDKKFPKQKFEKNHRRGVRATSILVDEDYAAGFTPPPTLNSINRSLSTTSDQVNYTEAFENQENGTNIQGHAHHSQGDLAKPYKIREDFLRRGIDANTLIDGNLGLFYFSTLSRFMALYKSGYDMTTSKTLSSISADTLRLMTAIIVEFTTEVIQRTIALKEQQRCMKGDIKVYGRIHDEITTGNVDYALEMMGMKGLSRKKYFTQLLGEDIAGFSEGESIAGEGDGSTDAGSNKSDDDLSNDDKLASPFTLLPLHHELHPPLMHLPKALLPHSSTSENAGMANDSLIPIDTDESDLEEELQEEMELDEADGVLARQYEVELWKEFDQEI